MSRDVCVWSGESAFLLTPILCSTRIPTACLCSHTTPSLVHVFQTPDYENVRKFGLQAAGRSSTSLSKAIYIYFFSLLSMGHLESKVVI